jgi:Na+/H+-dicarboxylate symporter
LSILAIPEKKRPIITALFEELNDVFIKMISFVMKIAPLGVFALLGTVIVSFGANEGVFIGMGKYVLVVLGGLFSLILFIYPILNYLFTGMKPLKFLRGIFPAQLLAFSTSSSAATLPLTTLQVRNELGVSDEVSGFVLPLGMTVNMDGTSLYQAVSAVFIAQIFQIDLSLMAQLTILLTALLASIGSPAIPGGSIVMMIVVLSSVGIPAEGLALILGVDRFLDMCRTMTNVTGDAMVSCIVDRFQKKK